MKKLKVNYLNEGKIAYFNGIRFTRNDSTGYYLSTIPIDGRRKRLHVVVWEYNNGEVPEGHTIHHYDEDKSNNDASNLVCLSAREHGRFHYLHMSEEHRERLRDANAWQYTEEGRAWHSEVQKNYWKSKPANSYICTHCGKVFTSKRNYGMNANKFCSKKCTNAHRYVKNKTTKKSERIEGGQNQC